MLRRILMIVLNNNIFLFIRSGINTEMGIFLRNNQLSQYAKLFSEENIDLDLFLTFNEDDLCEIGITNGDHRSMLLNELYRYRKNKVEDKNSLSASDLR